jgi:predicted outer membrane lipoprotein
MGIIIIIIILDVVHFIFIGIVIRERGRFGGPGGAVTIVEQWQCAERRGVGSLGILLSCTFPVLVVLVLVLVTRTDRGDIESDIDSDSDSSDATSVTVGGSFHAERNRIPCDSRCVPIGEVERCASGVGAVRWLPAGVALV